MAGLITDPEAAKRLARAIVSDILLYNKEKIRKGIEEDNLFEVLREELEEGQELYNKRVSPELRASTDFFERAIVDVLFKNCGDIRSKIW